MTDAADGLYADHAPEWCDGPPEGPHGDVCPDRLREPESKGEFVRQALRSAATAIDAYRWMLNEESATHEDALEQALSEIEEAAVCFVGIGSCGRGWCNHS